MTSRTFVTNVLNRADYFPIQMFFNFYNRLLGRVDFVIRRNWS